MADFPAWINCSFDIQKAPQAMANPTWSEPSGPVSLTRVHLYVLITQMVLSLIVCGTLGTFSHASLFVSFDTCLKFRAKAFSLDVCLHWTIKRRIVANVILTRTRNPYFTSCYLAGHSTECSLVVVCR